MPLLGEFCPKTVKIGLHLAKFAYFFKNGQQNSPPLLKRTKVITFVHIIRDIKTQKKISIHRLHLKTNHADPLTSEKNDHCEGQENCELLKAVDSEEPENLKEDNNFDYYKLGQNMFCNTECVKI